MNIDSEWMTSPGRKMCMRRHMDTQIRIMRTQETEDIISQVACKCHTALLKHLCIYDYLTSYEKRNRCHSTKCQHRWEGQHLWSSIDLLVSSVYTEGLTNHGKHHVCCVRHGSWPTSAWISHLILGILLCTFRPSARAHALHSSPRLASCAMGQQQPACCRSGA